MKIRGFETMRVLVGGLLVTSLLLVVVICAAVATNSRVFRVHVDSSGQPEVGVARENPPPQRDSELTQQTPNRTLRQDIAVIDPNAEAVDTGVDGERQDHTDALTDSPGRAQVDAARIQEIFDTVDELDRKYGPLDLEENVMVSGYLRGLPVKCTVDATNSFNGGCQLEDRSRNECE